MQEVLLCTRWKWKGTAVLQKEYDAVLLSWWLQKLPRVPKLGRPAKVEKDLEARAAEGHRYRGRQGQTGASAQTHNWTYGEGRA